MKRLKIAQQMIIVLFLSVLIPSVTIGLIISNVSQQSVRRELNYSVTQIARYIADGIQRFVETSDKEFSYIGMAVNDIPYKKHKLKYQ